MNQIPAILDSLNRGALRLFLGIACLAWPLAAEAHGPSDHTLELIVLDDRLEAVVTLGMDGVRGLLAEAEWSEAEIRTVVASRGPSARTRLPSDLANQIIELQGEDGPMPATTAWSRSDGMEVSIYLDYSRPHGDFSTRAVYLETVPTMSPGWISVRDGEGKELLVEMLSPDSVEAMVKSPARSNSEELPSTAADSQTEIVVRPDSGMAPELASSPGPLPIGKFVALGLLGFGVAALFHFRRPKRIDPPDSLP